MSNGNGHAVTWKSIQFWWPILLAVATIVASFTVVQGRVTELEHHQERTEAKLEDYDLAFTEIKVTLAEIQRDILYIRENMGEGGE